MSMVYQTYTGKRFVCTPRMAAEFRDKAEMAEEYAETEDYPEDRERNSYLAGVYRRLCMPGMVDADDATVAAVDELLDYCDGIIPELDGGEHRHVSNIRRDCRMALIAVGRYTLCEDGAEVSILGPSGARTRAAADFRHKGAGYEFAWEAPPLQTLWERANPAIFAVED